MLTVEYVLQITTVDIIGSYVESKQLTYIFHFKFTFCKFGT